ncbi:hypothetical protein [Lichenihabitans psoromatis]|uniref:hypothetical protein n=1 Tax=Lichenihabitans psoromatis TaxID=2528642 RepID=UPI001036C4C8|nr:hypothetical protein [Lichenihabitans psoromatis]
MQLEQAAADSGRSLGQEVEHRLEQSFRHELIDRDTQQLADLIGISIAVNQTITGKPWPKSTGAARYVYRRAVILMARIMGVDPIDEMRDKARQKWAISVEEMAIADEAAQERSTARLADGSLFDRMTKPVSKSIEDNDPEAAA